MALQNFSISFDVYGKIYFSNNNNEYQVNIDRNNNLILEKDKYDIIDKYDKQIYKIQNLDENSLKQKIEEDEDYNSDEVEEEEDYYPEDNEYIVVDEPIQNSDEIGELTDTFYDYGEHNLKFLFWSPDITDQIKIYYRKDGDITALYDTYIYDTNNQIIFKSNSPDDSSIYRIKIFPTGDILFRPIGNMEKKYILKVDKDELFLMC